MSQSLAATIKPGFVSIARWAVSVRLAIVSLVAGIIVIEWLSAIELRLAGIAIVVVSGLWILNDNVRHIVASRHVMQRSRLRSWSEACAVTLAAGFGLALLARWLGFWDGLGLHLFDKSLVHWIAIKLPTVLVQQIVLQWILFPAVRRQTGRPVVSAIVVTSIFSALHFPNALLMILTWFAGLLWIGLYLRNRRLIPLVASHFALAILAAGLCGEFILNMRVGASGWELLPRSEVTADGTMRVMPHAVSGCIDGFVQRGNQLILSGWAYDSIHQYAPRRFVLLNESNSQIMECELSQSEFVYDTSLSVSERHRIEVRLESPDRLVGQSLRIYAVNQNGFAARLGQNGPIRLTQLTNQSRTIQHFPVTVDGRIDCLTPAGDGVHLTGWIADFESGSSPNRLGIRLNGEERIVCLDSHRVEREEIARVAGNNRLINSGFRLDVHDLRLDNADVLEFYAVDNQDVWHPLPYTPAAAQRLAKLSPQLETPIR